MKSIIPLLIALCFSITILKAQYTPAMLFNDLQTELNLRSNAYNLPGTSVSIILKDGSKWTGTYGASCTSGASNIDTTKQWHWGSISKATTATIIMQMRDQGLLSLDDSIGTHFNTAPYPNIDGSNNTIRDLLQHTSNLNDPWSNSTAFQNLVSSNQCSVLNQASGFPFVGTAISNPNKNHLYTPYINYALLSSIIENISGNSLKQEYQNRIFTPLGMSNSTLVDSTYDLANMNGLYENGSPRCSTCQTAYLTRGGGGALLSSIQDITKFMNYLHSDSLLSDSSMTQMRTVVDANISAPLSCGGNVNVNYGLGVLQPNLAFAPGDTMKLYGHSGSGLSTGSVFHNVEEGWTISVVSNDYGPNVGGAPGGNTFTNALVFNILCLLHNNPVVFPAPVANFGFTVSDSIVTFTDSSGNNPNAWKWYFGDGDSSSLQNPFHTYADTGSYNVTLIASNIGGSDTFSSVVTIVPSVSTPVAAFTFIANGLDVNFTDNSSNNPISWSWDFGDGNSSNDQNPQHSYTAGGTYTVTLSASNSAGQSSFDSVLNLVVSLTKITFDNLRVFPNPFTDNVIFDFGNEIETVFQLSIYDLQGRCIDSFDLNKSERSFIWKSTDIQQGVYIYSIESADNVKQGKLIKK